MLGRVNYTYLDSREYCSFYSRRKSDSLPWTRSLFLMGIPLSNPKRDGHFLVEGINARIFRNVPCARFLVSLETTRARQEYGTALGHWALPLPAHGLGSVRPNVVKVHCVNFASSHIINRNREMHLFKDNN